MNSLLDAKKVVEGIAKQGITCEPHPIVDGCWKVIDGDLLKTDPYQDGRIYIQDAASQLIPFLLETMPRHSCLDVCAAPGGKLSQIARLSGGGAFLVGMDLRWQRLRSTARLHLRNWPGLCLVVADGKEELPFSSKFDRILVDAPCSGTATLQRNPDIRWRLSPADFQRLKSTQLTILENAAQHLKPDGTMVYSTCSLEEEENEGVVELFLGSHPEFCLGLPQNPRLHQLSNSRGYFKLLPSKWNSDGLFAAVLKRKSAAA
jgi:16S rRNA (cytosine967-C5)-methyltransferase